MSFDPGARCPYMPGSIYTNPEARGWVYVIQCGEFVKIGMSTNCEKRLADLQKACPYDLKMIARRSVPLYLRVEAEQVVHEMFAEHRHRGEWFRVSPEVAKAAVHRVSVQMQARHLAYMAEWARRGHFDEPPEEEVAAAKAAYEAAVERLREFRNAQP